MLGFSSCMFPHVCNKGNDCFQISGVVGRILLHNACQVLGIQDTLVFGISVLGMRASAGVRDRQ